MNMLTKFLVDIFNSHTPVAPRTMRGLLLSSRGGWVKLADGVMWPPPPVRYLTKEDDKTQVSSHLSLLELTRGQI